MLSFMLALAVGASPCLAPPKPVPHHHKPKAHFVVPAQSCVTIPPEPLILTAPAPEPELLPIPNVHPLYPLPVPEPQPFMPPPVASVYGCDCGPQWASPWPVSMGMDIGYGGTVAISIYRPTYNTSTVINAPVSNVTNDVHDSNSYVTNNQVSSSVSNVTNYATYNTSSTDSHNVTTYSDSHNVTTYNTLPNNPPNHWVPGGGSTKAPEISAGGIVPMLTLLIGALAVMRGRRAV